MKCKNPNCERDGRSPFTAKAGTLRLTCWFRLPISARRRFWRETSFDSKPPSAELIKVTIDELPLDPPLDTLVQ